MTEKLNLKIEQLPVEALQEYENNTREHAEADIEAIKESIKAFGFNDPIGIWSDDNLIVEGHGRLMAAKELGMTEVPCIRLDHMTDEERRAYAIAHNRTAELSKWNIPKLNIELAGIKSLDMSKLGLQTFNESDEYKEFEQKFVLEKTTDDCYTPAPIYEAVGGYVSKRYKISRDKFIRPFYPGGDYQNENYPDDCVVVDNPPFSIFAEIVDFYTSRGIKFFLFAPSLAIFNYTNRGTAIALQVTVIYENGAQVSTSFVTNMEDDAICAKTDPELYKLIFDANKEVQRKLHKELPKYVYPDNVVTAAMMGKWSRYGVEQEFRRENVKVIDALDEQKEAGKAIYGKGLLLSEKAAAEKAAAEKAAAENMTEEPGRTWNLSDREKEIIASLK